MRMKDNCLIKDFTGRANTATTMQPTADLRQLRALLIRLSIDGT